MRVSHFLMPAAYADPINHNYWNKQDYPVNHVRGPNLGGPQRKLGATPPIC